MANKVCTFFTTTQARTKDIMVQKGIIDKFLKVLDYPEFLSEVNDYTKIAKDKYSIDKGRLWFYENGKAIPNTLAMKLIDKSKGIQYKLTDNKIQSSDVDLSTRLFEGRSFSTLDRVLENISATNNDLKPISNRILYHLRKQGNNPKIEIVDSLPKNALGVYKGTNKIEILSSGNFKDLKADATIIHEALHALTTTFLNNDSKVKSQLEKLFYEAKTAVYNQYKVARPEGKFYGLKNINEFISEFYSNPEFVEVLKSVPVEEGNWFKRILDSILSLFNLGTSSSLSLYSKVEKISDDILEQSAKTKQEFFQDEFYKEDSIEEKIEEEITFIQRIKFQLYKKKEDIENKIKQTTDNATKTKYTNYDKYLDEIIKQIDDSHKASGVLKFLQSIYSETIGKVAKLNEFKNNGGKLPLNEIIYLKSSLEISNVINDLYDELITNKESDLFENKIKVKELINSIKNSLDEIKIIVNREDKDALAATLKEETEKLSEEEIKSLLKKGYGDVSWFTKMFDLASDSIDPIVALLVKKIQKHKFLGSKKADIANDKITRVTQDLIAYQKSKGINTNNYRELYDFALEVDKDNKITGNLIQDKPNEFRLREKEFFSNNPNASKSQVRAFYKSIEHLRKNDKYNQLMKLPDSNPLKIWYKTVMEVREEAGKNIGNFNKYKIPTLYKSDINIINEKGISLESIGEVVRNKFITNPTEYNYQQPATVSGNPINYLPVYFNTPTEFVELDKLSLNLATSIMTFNKMVYNYGEMNAIYNEVELTKNALAERDVVITESGKPIVNRFINKLKKKFGTEEEQNIEDYRIIKGNETNSYKQLVDFIDQVYYNKPSERTLFLGKDITKTIDTLNKYTGIAKLSVNIFQAGSQVITGSLWRKVEAVGGDVYTSENLNKATSIYYGETKFGLDLISDSIKDRPTNKINLLRKYFNIGIQHNLLASNLEKTFDLKHLSALNTSGEHMLSSVTMLAVLDNIKVKNPKGDEVSLYEAFSVDNNDNLIKNFDFKFDDLDAFKVHQKIKKINQRIDGVYNDEDRISMKKSALGRSLMLFRGWVVPSYLNRFQYGYDKEGNVTSKYNYADDTENIGYYTSTAIFLKEALTEAWRLKSGMAIKEVWNNLSLKEKKNFYKFCTEQSMVVGMLILVQALKYANPDDDKDKNAILSILTVLANRTNTELQQYLNPSKTIDMLNSPAAGISILESTVGLAWQTIGFELQDEDGNFNWLINDTYEKGQRKGDYKLGTQVKKWIPIWGQVDRLSTINEEKDI